MFSGHNPFNTTSGFSFRGPSGTLPQKSDPDSFAHVAHDYPSPLQSLDDYVDTTVEYAPRPDLPLNPPLDARFLSSAGYWNHPASSFQLGGKTGSWDNASTSFASTSEAYDPVVEAAIQTIFSAPDSPAQEQNFIGTPPMAYNWTQASPSPSSPSSILSHAISSFGGQEIDPDGNAEACINSTHLIYSFLEQVTMFHEAENEPFVTYSGPLVPQQIYRPHTTADRRRYVDDVGLNGPIKFYVQNPAECGIPLKDALFSRTDRLLDRQTLMFEGNVGPSISIRLQWPGYRPWSRQIPTKDFKNPPGPITLAKLTKNIAKCVERFIKDMANSSMEDETKKMWKVGNAGQCIKLEDLVLVSLHHVSMGSWQPQLRLRTAIRLA